MLIADDEGDITDRLELRARRRGAARNSKPGRSTRAINHSEMSKVKRERYSARLVIMAGRGETNGPLIITPARDRYRSSASRPSAPTSALHRQTVTL